MLASPLIPASSFSTRNSSEDSSQCRPSKDLEAFNSLLPPPIEFIEGSSTGAYLSDSHYEPINGTPEDSTEKTLESSMSTPSTPSQPSHHPPPSHSPSYKRTCLYSRNLEFSWPSNYTVGAGMANMGNTCFLNSALQCLLHTPPLLHILDAHTRTIDPCLMKGKLFCMTCTMRRLAQESYRNRVYIVPEPIYAKMHFIAKHMRRGRQEDSHEFLRYAVDALQKSCLAGHSPKADPMLAETTWVHKLFGGRLRSRVTCRVCGHNSDTFDSILDLSLDIHGVSTLNEALRKFVAVDYLKGADKYKCEKCKKPVIAEKQFTLHKAPTVLTVHLKRFSPLGRKIGHHLHYDDRISLKTVMSEGQYGATYSLYGVICHSGGGPNSGHYFAHVKGSNGWYEMNDEIVTRNRNSPTALKSAYMLFYMRDKGQALEAAIAPTLPKPLPKGAGVVGCMKKRKVVLSDDDDDDEDKGVKTTRPSDGSPSPPQPIPDPQAAQLKKKIEAAQKPPEVLLGLSQYDSDDEGRDEKDASNNVNGIGDSSLGVVHSSPTQPPSSSPVSRSPTIPTSSFYASYTSAEKMGSDKKRKSPHDNPEEVGSYARRPLASRANTSMSPLSFSSMPRRPSVNAMNPFNRLKGSNNLHTNIQTYGKRRRRMGI